MAEFITNLPPVPDDTGYTDYIIYENNGKYTVTFFDDLYTDTLRSQGSVDYGPYIYYTLDGSEWDYGGGYLGSHPVYNDVSRYGDIVQSTKTLYNPDGTVYIVGSRGGSGLVGGLSSSNFLYCLVDTWSVIPLVVVAIVSLFGFRKVFSFLHGLIKGA